MSRPNPKPEGLQRPARPSTRPPTGEPPFGIPYRKPEAPELRVAFFSWPLDFRAPPAFLWANRLDELTRVPHAGEAVTRGGQTYTVQHVVHDLEAPAQGYDVRVHLLEVPRPTVELAPGEPGA